MIYEYRVTKYDPEKRIGGAYLEDEWTCYSEIGRKFKGVIFTQEEYEGVERNHISFLQEILSIENTKNIRIRQLEKHSKLKWKENQYIERSKDLSKLIQDCLRKKCWCRLESEQGFIHFGYDYYMYLGCSCEYEIVKEIATKYNLFAEEMESPYKKVW